MSNYLEDRRKEFEKNRPLLRKNLFIIRKAAGWSAEALAERIGVAKRTILKIENGNSDEDMSKPVFISIMTILYDEVSRKAEDDILCSVLGLIFNSDDLTDENRTAAECFISGLKSKTKAVDNKVANDGLKKIVGVTAITAITASALLAIIKKII